MGAAECLWLVGIDFCHLKTDNLESLEHAWHPEGGGGSKTPGGGTPPPPHHTVVTLWSVVLRFGVFWRLLATFGELRIEISTDMVAKIELKSMFVGRSAGLSGGILELKIDLVGHVGHLGCHLGGILVVFGCLGRILGASFAILGDLGAILGRSGGAGRRS